MPPTHIWKMFAYALQQNNVKEGRENICASKDVYKKVPIFSLFFVYFPNFVLIVVERYIKIFPWIFYPTEWPFSSRQSTVYHLELNVKNFHTVPSNIKEYYFFSIFLIYVFWNMFWNTYLSKNFSLMFWSTK